MAATLVRRYQEVAPVRYWKPVQTGIEEDDDARTVGALTGCGLMPGGVRLPRPVSPHLAARLSGQVIDVAGLVARASARPDSDRVVVEGAGGVLVPLSDSALMVDLINALGLPAVVVARTTLGTINHTLLTLEALRSRGIAVAGVVLNGPANDENRAAIATFGRVAVLGHLQPVERVDAAAVTAWAAALDPEGRLAEGFRA